MTQAGGSAPIEFLPAWRRQLQIWRTKSEQAPPVSTGGTHASILAQLRARLVTPMPRTTPWGWILSVAVLALAAVMRLVHLNRPARIVFDETYYVRQAYSLLQLGYEGTWPEDSDPDFADGDFSGLSSKAGPIVHPSVGKWMIALGIRLFGAADPVGWRIIAALTGIASIWLVMRIGARLFSSVGLGIVAGLLLALDGVHLVMSRISILDIFVMFWALLGFYFLLLDRHWYRERLAHRTADVLAAGPMKDPWGPSVGVRPWLVAAGISLGLATSVKWSGLYFVAVFGVLAVVWNLTARHIIGAPMWLGATVVRDGIPAFLMLVPTAIAVYLASWIPWARTSDGLYRSWATEVNAVADNPVRTWLPDIVNSWVEYHLWMWRFHNGLTSEHSYMAKPAGWLIQQRPTSFAWTSIRAEEGAELLCGADRCASAILAVGNPALWWGGVAALAAVIWFAFKQRDWRAWAILGGYLAGYVPWLLLYSHRTIFNFYTVAFVPFVALAFTYALAKLGQIPIGAPTASGSASLLADDDGSATAAEPATPVAVLTPLTPASGATPNEAGTPVSADSRTSPASASTPVSANSAISADSPISVDSAVSPDDEDAPAPPANRPSVWAVLVTALGQIPGLIRALPTQAKVALQSWQHRKPQLVAVTAILLVVVLVAWFFWPVWTAQWLPYDQWRLRIFLPSWI